MTSIEIPTNAWAEAGTDLDPRGRLSTTIAINGMDFRLLAFRVKFDQGNIQVVDTPCPQTAGWFHEFAVASDNQYESFQTLDIGGTYAVFGTC